MRRQQLVAHHPQFGQAFSGGKAHRRRHHAVLLFPVWAVLLLVSVRPLESVVLVLVVALLDVPLVLELLLSVWLKSVVKHPPPAPS